MIKKLDFHPLPGLFSPHLQMIAAQYGPAGKPPPSKPFLVPLADGDKLSCQISLPTFEKNDPAMVVMVHGLGGSHDSRYLIRQSRKLYEEGLGVIRVNLRGSGSGKGLAAKPYNAGTSQDILAVLKTVAEQFPGVKIILVGFSMGGNIALKLGGELGLQGTQLIDSLIAICPTIRLYHSVFLICKKSNWLYHRYYLKGLMKQGAKWVGNRKIGSLYEYDDKITAPLWGYRNALDYYDSCSSYHFLKKIQIPCQILFAEDDPFIDCHILDSESLPPNVSIFTTKYGGHMGYLGWTSRIRSFYWMDELVLKWVKEAVSRFS